MNSMERLGSIMQRTHPDRQPFTCTLSMYGAKLISCPLTEYYRKAEKYFQGQQKVAELIQPDVLFSPFSLPLEAEAFGSELKFFQKNPPNMIKPVIRGIADIERLKFPDLKKSRQHQFFLESVKRMADKYEGIIPIATPTCAPVDFPILLMGIEGWLDTFLFYRDQAVALISRLSEYFVEWTSMLFAAGSDFIVLPIIFCNPNFLNEDLIINYSLDLYRKAFQQVKGPLVMHHGGARMGEFIQYYKELPNVAAFQIDHRDKFPAARKKIGNDHILIGNIDGPNLWRFNPEQMKKVCRVKKAEIGDDLKVIFATSNADVAYDTDLETLQSIRQFMEKEWRFDA